VVVVGDEDAKYWISLAKLQDHEDGRGVQAHRDGDGEHGKLGEPSSCHFFPLPATAMELDLDVVFAWPQARNQVAGRTAAKPVHKHIYIGVAICS
jgi:hypothetical protein